MRLLFQVKIWFQNRRTKWKKIDNISNAEAAEHKNNSVHKDGSKQSSEDTKLSTNSKHISQSSNSSIESDSKSSATSTVAESTLSTKNFKNILQTNRLSLASETHFQTQIDSAKEVLLNLSFNVEEKS